MFVEYDVYLCKSDKKNKRYIALIFEHDKNEIIKDEDDEYICLKKIYFGNPKIKHFTIDKNKEKKREYLKHTSVHNYFNPSFWERYLLWNYPDINESIDCILKNYPRIKTIHRLNKII